MDDQSAKQENENICVNIPKALYERVEVLCKSRTLEPHEFILEAISEKLASVHKERRKKQRL